MGKLFTIAILFIMVASCSLAQAGKRLSLVNAPQSPRAQYGIAQLQKSFKASSFNGSLSVSFKEEAALPKESFEIIAASRANITLKASDPSGFLYGCLDLAETISHGRSIEQTKQVPEMVLRGACIGLQKPYYLPGRTVYEYPYTPATFPWFYNKQVWVQYLDSLARNRMNSLFLWNGHPFASLVRLKDYPYAVEVDSATFKKNEEIYSFLTKEADRRGIWVIQMFYNIIVSKPFAEKHGIKTQDRERPITPLIADYTRKSIAAFVSKYPNIGLMVCLGEAMEGVGNDDIEWFTRTIIPGVRDGLALLGSNVEPPIVLRAHDTDAPAVMKAALPLYRNLYTEAKFNGEALTTDKPRGSWAALHQTLSGLGSVQIENVHILANLEPFRYGATGFIQSCVQGMQDIMKGRGIHLYPQASYWDWPYSADSVKGKRLLQVERDWLWYAAWSRYAWNSRRDSASEKEYWGQLLAQRFGMTAAGAASLLQAYEESGQIAPKILRRFGITDGNRQTMTLGMTMPQLVNPTRFGVFTLLYEAESPEGETLTEFALRESKQQLHHGETPLTVINDIRSHAYESWKLMEAASKSVTRDREEFSRIANDIRCYATLARHYASKAEAAIAALAYKHTGELKYLDSAAVHLQESLSEYRLLADLTRNTYLYANSMQTQQRKIPFRGVDATFKTWKEVLVPFEKEYHHFVRKLDSLKQVKLAGPVSRAQFQDAIVTTAAPAYKLVTGAAPFGIPVAALDASLNGLTGYRFDTSVQQLQGTRLALSNTSPVNVLVGYFNSADPRFARAPELETNATANDYGQAEISIANALIIAGLPPVNVHSYRIPAGTQELRLPKGICLVLGIVKPISNFKSFDAGRGAHAGGPDIDWLFE